jgi:hypothetical protein
VTPPFLGTTTPTEDFTTDEDGNGHFRIDLDIPVVGGAVSFQRGSIDAVQVLRDFGSGWTLVRIPAPIANPEGPNISAPPLIACGRALHGPIGPWFVSGLKRSLVSVP